MTAQKFVLRIQAHARELTAAVAAKRADRIRNRLAYITANVDALADLLEEES
ncbi:hypothetical protein [Arthrobacter sp. SDTb3-6]|uniref:hypothetical protein n=1 Tax=Arthrobacter sp. SDTb3-6 TaxID=2713571 RepID=UPI00159D2B8A|nr:hypothetical protein [Arthrobacter sp. SDTb3-6]NVM97811.1 hypothetical protein [Arthrobacter sp. SDTb3-6]